MEFILTLLGVALGVPAGLWLDRLVEKRRVRAERETLLEAYFHAVKSNLDVLGQIERDVQLNSVSFYGMNTAAFEALASSASALLPDLELHEKLTNFHYQLDHLNRKLGIKLSSLTGVARSYSDWPKINEQLTVSIHDHARVLHEDAHEILPAINELLPAEKRLEIPPPSLGARKSVREELLALENPPEAN